MPRFCSAPPPRSISTGNRFAEEVQWFEETLDRLQGTYQFLVVYQHKSIFGSEIVDSNVARYLRPQWFPVFQKYMLQMVQDMIDGKLELRAHPSKKIHAKFYILYPDNFNQHTFGAAITGSSNLSGNGLGIGDDKQYAFILK